MVDIEDAIINNEFHAICIILHNWLIYYHAQPYFAETAEK